MKIRSQMIILFLLLISCVVSLFVVIQNIEKRTHIAAFELEAAEKIRLFNKFLYLKGKSLKTLAFDYTYWDEMVDFVQNKTMKWADEMLSDETLESYNVDVIWAYNIKSELVYFVSSEKEISKKFPIDTENISSVFKKSSFCHFFATTSKGVMEIRGATIHASNDAERTGQSYGYFFVGRLWDLEYLEQLSMFTGYQVSLLAVRKNQPISLQQTDKNGTVTFNDVLYDWQQKPNYIINATIISKYILDFNKRSKLYLMYFLSMGFVLSALYAVFAIISIGMPLRNISKSLKTEDADSLLKLHQRVTEFGEIANLIKQFFEQKKNLTKEIEERKKAETHLLYTEQKMQAALSLKSEFISIVSHELRTPLAPIKEGMSIVLDGLVGPVNEKQKYLLETTIRNANRLNRLINDVLDFQKLDAGKMEFDFNENPLEDVINETYSTMKLLSDQKGIEFVVDYDPNMKKMIFDRDKILQVMTNLVGNAIKYTQEGTIKIVVRKEDDFVRIVVEDTGIGIKEEEISKLFESFQQLSSRREHGVKEGTGLGLAITKEIVLKHKGKIWVESVYHKGSKFYVILPLKQSSEGGEDGK